MIDVLRRLVWARIVAIVACSLTSVATTLAQECANRGQLDALYCDENNDLVADVPTDPKKLRDPSTLAFAHTPVEHPSVYESSNRPQLRHGRFPEARSIDHRMPWTSCCLADHAPQRP